MTKTCATCAHGNGEGTIRFCAIKNGAAYDATAVCALYEEGIIIQSIDPDEEDE